jgi:hypothetical protein
LWAGVVAKSSENLKKCSRDLRPILKVINLAHFFVEMSLYSSAQIIVLFRRFIVGKTEFKPTVLYCMTSLTILITDICLFDLENIAANFIFSKNMWVFFKKN